MCQLRSRTYPLEASHAQAGRLGWIGYYVWTDKVHTISCVDQLWKQPLTILWRLRDGEGKVISGFGRVLTFQTKSCEGDLLWSVYKSNVDIRRFIAYTSVPGRLAWCHSRMGSASKAVLLYNNDVQTNYSTTEREDPWQLLVAAEVHGTKDESRLMRRLSVLDHFVLPSVTSDATVRSWSNDLMMFWKIQFNFDVLCVTAGCSVAVNTHFTPDYKFLWVSQRLARSVFCFLVYFTICQIFKQMGCPIPTDGNWRAFSNFINKTQYKMLYNEFPVDPKTKWVWELTDSGGWGSEHPVMKGGMTTR